MTPDRLDSKTLAGLTDQMPALDTAQWGKLGAGVGLVLAGSGLVSIGTLLRLAVVAGGGLLAYRTWSEATGAGTGGAVDSRAVPAVPQAWQENASRAGSVDAGQPPARRDTLASGNDQNSPPGASDLTDVPAVDLSGA